MVTDISRVLLIALVFAGCTSTKNAGRADTPTIENLRAHIQFLSDDKLEGRRTGTKGEELARDYIIEQFKKIGLVPKGTEYYPQSFIVNDGKRMGDVTEFEISGSKLLPGRDYFVYPFSPDKYVGASASISVHEVNVPWFIDLGEILEENKGNPHFDLAGNIRTTAISAQNKGATAVIFYNNSSIDDQQVFDSKDRSETISIPTVYMTKQSAAMYLSNKQATLNISIRSSIGEKNRIGYNVIGYIDNHAPTTIILGAHYDHLGYGEDGNSMIRTGEKNIHNGADDNASGTAALIEIAGLLKNSKAKNNNYLFIAFSGEELGLYGSKYFVDNSTIDIKQVNYMINMDMVGRLNDSSKVLTIGGFGTSPTWNSVVLQKFSVPLYPGHDMKISSLNIRIDSSGTGPSDHTSFYRKDIPVLFYFTGLHSDYHKPSDDADKINYHGTRIIVLHIQALIESLDNKGRLAFTKTREAQTTTTARMNVTLGIMPDYTFSGAGVRADGVSEGKPAQKAGLKTGDIIIQLGEHSISSMESYMQALGKFKKGEKTVVKFKRGEEVLQAEVQF